MPGDLAEQVPWVHEACEAMGVPIYTAEGFEADDVIGTLATKAGAHGLQAAIVTGDKDFFQLVGDGIRVYNPKDEGTWYDAEGVKQKLGVAPSQVCDVLALMGDSIDNVKGVPGIGEKGATRVDRAPTDRSKRCCSMRRRSSRRSIAKACSPTPTRRGRAASWSRSAPIVDVPFEIERFRFRGADRERCYALFSKMEFRTLVPEFAPTASSVDKDYALIESAEELHGADRGDEGGRPVQHEGDHRRHRAGARHAGRHRRLDAGREGALHPARSRGLRRRVLAAEGRGARAAGAAAHRSVDRKDRPRPEGRSDRARPARRRRAEPAAASTR